MANFSDVFNNDQRALDSMAARRCATSSRIDAAVGDPAAAARLAGVAFVLRTSTDTCVGVAIESVKRDSCA